MRTSKNTSNGFKATRVKVPSLAREDTTKVQGTITLDMARERLLKEATAARLETARATGMGRGMGTQ